MKLKTFQVRGNAVVSGFLKRVFDNLLAKNNLKVDSSVLHHLLYAKNVT